MAPGSSTIPSNVDSTGTMDSTNAQKQKMERSKDDITDEKSIDTGTGPASGQKQETDIIDESDAMDSTTPSPAPSTSP